MAKKTSSKTKQSGPVSAQTVGGIAGAALGGVVAGPIGAIAGGLAGALVGDSAVKGDKPVKKAVEAVQSVGRRSAKSLASVKKTVASNTAKKPSRGDKAKKRSTTVTSVRIPKKEKAANSSGSVAKKRKKTPKR